MWNLNLKDFFESVYKKASENVIGLVIAILLVFGSLYFIKSNDFVLVKASGDKKIRIEVYDKIIVGDCLDSLTKEDSLFVISQLYEKNYVPKKIKYIAVHCTASREGVYPSKNWWYSYFYKQKYPGCGMVGYNYLISKNEVFELRPINKNSFIDQGELVWGVKGFNQQTISIAYVGGVDSKLKNKDTRTIRQQYLLDSLIIDLRSRYKWVEVKGHGTFPNANKSCPNYNPIYK